MTVDIYGTDKRIENFKKLLIDSEALECNKEYILKFFDYILAKGLSKSRVLIYANRLIPIARMVKKDFKEMSKDDIQHLVMEINRRDSWGESTKTIFKVTIKRFWKWLEGNDEIHPDKVKWIKTKKYRNEKLLPEQLLTREDIQNLIDTAWNPRDKAFIAVLAESGCRIGEILGIHLKQISFDEKGAKIAVSGKTGNRQIRLLSSVNYLSFWLEHHPQKKDPEATLWVNLTRKRLGEDIKYCQMAARLKKIKEKLGIKKPCNFHAFRHAKASELARLGFNEVQMCEFMGWRKGSSDMPAVYVHLSSRDMDSALLKAYGMESKETEEKTFQPCRRCQVRNDISATFCKGCGAPLRVDSEVFSRDQDTQAFMKKAGKLMALLEDPEVMNFLAKKMAER